MQISWSPTMFSFTITPSFIAHCRSRQAISDNFPTFLLCAEEMRRRWHYPFNVLLSQNNASQVLLIVRQLEADILTISRGNSILVLTCFFKVSEYISECWPRWNFLWALANTFFVNITIKLYYCPKRWYFKFNLRINKTPAEAFTLAWKHSISFMWACGLFPRRAGLVIRIEIQYFNNSTLPKMMLFALAEEKE